MTKTMKRFIAAIEKKMTEAFCDGAELYREKFSYGDSESSLREWQSDLDHYSFLYNFYGGILDTLNSPTPQRAPLVWSMDSPSPFDARTIRSQWVEW